MFLVLACISIRSIYWRVSFNYSLTVCDRQNCTSIFLFLPLIGQNRALAYTRTQTRCIVSARNRNPLINRKKFIILCGSSIGWLKEIVRWPSALLAVPHGTNKIEKYLYYEWFIQSNIAFFTIWFVCSGSLSSSVSPSMTQCDGKRKYKRSCWRTFRSRPVWPTKKMI